MSVQTQDLASSEDNLPTELPAEFEPTVNTQNTDTEVFVSIDGNIISHVDFHLDSETRVRHRATASPFEFRLAFAGLSPGEHRVRARIAVDLLGSITMITRFIPFTVPEQTTNSCNQMGVNRFFGCYYEDIDLKDLVFTRYDSSIDFDYGRSAPDSRLGADNFSIRWQGQFDFSRSGTYTFTATADDGVRLFVNDRLVINEWKVQAATSYTADVQLSQGRHKIVLEYYEKEWDASVALSWNRKSSQTPPPDTDPPAPPPEDPAPKPGAKNSRTYQTDESNFMNPERGFHNDIQLINGGSYNHVRNSGYTIARSYVRLDAYRNQSIPSSFLNELRSGLQRVRTAGIKIVLRFSYNFGKEPDATINRVEEHIQQLRPILREYSDVIAVLQAGFIGAWGEWHSSTNNLTTPANKRRVNDALLEALPATRMVQLRMPWHRRHALGSSPDPNVIHFGGSKDARTGFKNDCFVSTASDSGTYNESNQTQDRREAAQFTRYTVTGGETCAIGFGTPRQDCSVALKELEEFNWDYLNNHFYNPVLNRWRTQGCYDEIARRLGYRLSLQSASVPAAAQRGSNFSVELNLRNTGFGKVYNPRPIDVVLRRRSSGEVRTVRAVADARAQLPLAGQTRNLTLTVRLPSDLISGEYDVLLSLPDAASQLAHDTRYNIRIANQDMWESDLGLNNLRLTTTVE